MKNIVAVLSLAVSLPLGAQEFSMSAEDIAAMQKRALEAEACMAKIDQGHLLELQAEGEQKLSEITALCNAGKRNEAQSTAIGYGKSVMADPVMKELQACLGLMNMVVPQATWAELERDDTPTHVCDL